MRLESDFSVVDFAWQIIDMDRKLGEQAAEIAHLREYKAMYEAEINRGIEHGQKMMGNLLTLCLTPGVAAACQKHAELNKEQP
jgi:hypothetical protein